MNRSSDVVTMGGRGASGETGNYFLSERLQVFRPDGVFMVLSVLKPARGQAVVELTLSFLLFITMFFSIVEFAHLVYARLTSQHALREAGRYMVTGRTAQDPKGNDIPRLEAVREVFCGNLIATGLGCPDFGPQFSLTCLDGPCVQPGGGPEQTVMATVTLSKHPLFPFFRPFFSDQGVTLQLSTTWKNEPFSQ